MILRRHTSSLWSFLLLTLLFSTCASAAEDDTNPFDCHLTVDSVKYDLTSLKGEKSIERTRESPPGKIKDEIFFNLCENFKPKDTLKEHCPEGTRFCFTKTFFQGDKDGVLIAVIPIAESSQLKPESSALSSSEKGLSITLHGPVSKASGHAQSVNLEMLCVKEEDKQDKPEFKSYDGEVLKLSWKSPAACATHDDKKTDPPPGDGEQKPGDSKKDEVGSGVGWFFLMLILAFLAYMGLGAYYNYSTYGATGSDLIPHRDFWREVPYMMRDVVGHLCSSVRPTRQSRGGYVSV